MPGPGLVIAAPGEPGGKSVHLVEEPRRGRPRTVEAAGPELAVAEALRGQGHAILLAYPDDAYAYGLSGPRYGCLRPCRALEDALGVPACEGWRGQWGLVAGASLREYARSLSTGHPELAGAVEGLDPGGLAGDPLISAWPRPVVGARRLPGGLLVHGPPRGQRRGYHGEWVEGVAAATVYTVLHAVEQEQGEPVASVFLASRDASYARGAAAGAALYALSLAADGRDPPQLTVYNVGPGRATPGARARLTPWVAYSMLAAYALPARNLAMGQASLLSKALGQRSAKLVAASLPAAAAGNILVLLAAAALGAQAGATAWDALSAPAEAGAGRGEAWLHVAPGPGQAGLLAPVYASLAYARLAARSLRPVARFEAGRRPRLVLRRPRAGVAEAVRGLRVLPEPQRSRVLESLEALVEGLARLPSVGGPRAAALAAPGVDGSVVRPAGWVELAVVESALEKVVEVLLGLPSA